MVLATLSIALALASPAPDLQAKLPIPYSVSCSTNEEWVAETSYHHTPPTANGYTLLEDASIHLSPWVCDSLRSASPNPAYLLTLYHEFIHAALLTRVESQADCLAIFLYRYWLRKYWAYTPSHAQQAYYEAWRYHTLKPPEYQGSCTFEVQDNVSYANGL